MREVTVAVFQFGELSDKAKERARDWFRELIDNTDYQTTEETCTELAAKLGFDAVLRWSGFSSQGDGACLDGTWRAEDFNGKWIEDQWPTPDGILPNVIAVIKDIARRYPEAHASLTHSGHYSHDNSVTIELELYNDYTVPETASQANDRNYFKEAARLFMRWCYRRLDKQNDYLHSEAYIDETIKANEYEFLEDGKRWSRNGR